MINRERHRVTGIHGDKSQLQRDRVSKTIVVFLKYVLAVAVFLLKGLLKLKL